MFAISRVTENGPQRRRRPNHDRELAMSARPWPRMRPARFRTSSPRRQRPSRRPGLEPLEGRLAPAGILNGDFSISDPADPAYGWTTRGNAAIAGGQGILTEGTT